MKSRLWMIIGAIIGLVIIVPVTWYLAAPLFIDQVVEEEFPAQPSAVLAQAPAEEPKEMDIEGSAVVAEMPAEPGDDQPVLTLQGQFKDGDSFHKGSGQAALYQLADGSHVLRFDDFSATNGPDLHVILSSHPAPTTSDEVMQGYLDLGSLKGNIGSQNYEIPAGADISSFKSVIIYCQPFHVIFATASLSN